MKNDELKTSVKMAIIMGIFLPLAETIRRINQIHDYREFLSWFDDYILGGILLWGAYTVIKKKSNSIAYLISAWGIATGALIISFLGQFKFYLTSTDDPGIFSTSLVLNVKGLILVYMLIGLNKTLKANLDQGTRLVNS